LGLPAIAVSMVGDSIEHYETAARVIVDVVQRLHHEPLPADTILNINVPDIPWEQIQGLEVTRLGHRHKSEPVIKMEDPRGRDIYWVGPPGGEQDAGPGTDFHAVNNNKVSITPIQIDLTCYKAIDQVSEWVKGMNA
ncbi:MAG: 5'/3'-nucleotidase SurE, partial [Gammaproteobacteria bacterium]|nr:5'/3'-nucleotidase SurE [Gammaproteobacteria bacterium]